VSIKKKETSMEFYIVQNRSIMPLNDSWEIELKDWLKKKFLIFSWSFEPKICTNLSTNSKNTKMIERRWNFKSKNFSTVTMTL